MKPFAITLEPGTSVNNKTGTWRTKKPVYVHRLPPCNKACPAGENIQEWLSWAETGDARRAWRELVKNNPLPAVMGRICYHPCESACNRKDIDSAVGINSVERFIGDEAIKNNWAFDKPASKSGKRVLVIGAGPAGLSAAYHLAILGHQVVIQDANLAAGGMMRYGIPSYRLPRDVLDAEVKRILDLGVELQLGAKVDNVLTAMKDGFDAAFIAVGAHVARQANFPVGGKARILDAVSVLRGMEIGDKPNFGKRVAVYGGGNTALDVARTAVRLGATVTIVYRRNREKMPANDVEIDEAIQEGIDIKWLTTIKKVDGKNITLESMELDAKGYPQPTGKTGKMEADTIVLAVGQDADLAPVSDVQGVDIDKGMVKVDENMMTGLPGLFAGGDMVSSARTATTGIGHGKRAARHIDMWLRHASEKPSDKHETATAERLNKWYYTTSPGAHRPEIDLNRRKSSFDEVQGGLAMGEAINEARRCLSCGNCFECDNCYGHCPDNAIKKLGTGKGFEFNYDYCKGCALCVTECPCGAIDMVAEDI
jgi:NADPH-dependent glutamate synthase beta subunit-like oxidoreductase